MPFVITDACIDIKDRTCVSQCPVDCIYEGGRKLYLHPEECIDCGACESVCPANAIYPVEDVPAAQAGQVAAGARFARSVRQVRLRRTRPDGAGRWVPGSDVIVLDAQLATRSVGYRGVELPGVPFGDRLQVIPHVGGRVRRDRADAPGEYVVGWIKRGPTGSVPWPARPACSRRPRRSDSRDLRKGDTPWLISTAERAAARSRDWASHR